MIFNKSSEVIYNNADRLLLDNEPPLDLSGINNLNNCNKETMNPSEEYIYSILDLKLNQFLFQCTVNLLEQNFNFVKYKNNILKYKYLYLKNIKLCANLCLCISKMNSEDNFAESKYKYIETTNSLIIICKGTNKFSYSDIITDLTIGYKTNYHKGMFYKAASILFRTNLNKNKFQKIQLPNFDNEPVCINLIELIKKYNNEKKSIILTGYSLGAGICINMLIILILENIINSNNKNIQLYLFGCPPVIPKVLRNVVSKYIINIRNYTDIVTHLSWSLWTSCYTLFLTPDIKNLILYNCTINESSEQKNFKKPNLSDNIDPHKLRNYINILNQIDDIVVKDDELYPPDPD
jgi:hypothetical protein